MIFTPEHIRRIGRYPHLLGHMVGKKKLSALHSDWAREVWLPERHTGLMAHRGAYKTTAITEIGLVWWLLFHPNDRVALLRETHGSASDTLRTVAQYFETELVQELFRELHGRYPRALVNRADRLVYSFKSSITKEGSIDSFGIDTVPTGSHFDIILADDIVTIKDRFSRAKRERTKANIQEIMTNILDPGCFLRMVGTPWHAEDAWSLKGFPTPSKYDVYSTGILTPRQIEEKMATTSDVMFSINYLLEHKVSGDTLFGDPTFGRWITSKQKIVAHLDAAYGGKDTTALTVMQRREDGSIQAWGKLYHGHVEKHIKDIQRELKLRGCRWMCLEDNGDKGFLAKLLRVRDGDYLLRAETYHESQNKHIKIVSYLKHHWDDITWCEDMDPEYMQQCCDYSEDTDVDDAPDSGASLLRNVFFPQEGHSSSWRSLYE